MLRYLPALSVALMGATTVVAQTTITCDDDNHCPESAPCCSQYGQCGVGAYCLGGCDPVQSFSLDSCAPAPVCKDGSFSMDSNDRWADISEYLGDSSKTDWVTQGQPLVNGDYTLLTMPANSVGTVLASTTYMWYGNVKATMKTSRGAGVVTAFILFSDVKDELDYEWVGVDLATAQTNYYFQGIDNWTNSQNITDLEDTFETWHTYEYNWTPDKTEWIVDGQVGRTLLKSDTWNSTTNQFKYPQTPARVQFSIWPAGASSNAPGTIAWAGGAIDWNSQDIQDKGYDYASVKDIVITCYDATSAPGTNSGVSYTYNDDSATNNTVVDGDDPTVLGSFQATGLDMNKGKDTSEPQTSDAPATVPGSSGGSNGNDNPPTNPDSSDPSATSAAPASCTGNGFTQDCSASTSTDGSPTSVGTKQPDHFLGVSTFAAVIAVAGMMLL